MRKKKRKWKNVIKHDIMEEFCLVSGLKFGVKNSTDYNKAKDPIPFRRRVFSSDLERRPIRGKDVGLLIESGVFKKLDDNDAVILCCVGILQLVLLGVEDRRPVPNWILWDANVKRWQPLNASDPTNETDTKRLVSDETEARSRWWVSSRAYFDGRSFEDEQIPHHLNRNNYFEVPFEMYREFVEQRRGNQQMKEKNGDMYEKMTRFMEDMRRVPETNTTPIIADQHFRNLCDRARRKPQPSVYMPSPYTVLPHTTVLTKKRIDKTKKIGKTKKLSPLNLGNTFADENVSGDDVTITGVQHTDNYLNYEIVDPDKGYKLSSFFWPQLVPHLCTYRRERSWPEGWLSSDHMDSWIQIQIREMTENANWTLAKSGTVCLHQENNRFMILTYPHNIGTLDGSMRPFSSWNDVTWVYMPINAGGVHWVTGAINLVDSIFYVFDSMESESRMLMLEQQEIGPP
nr:hypothetical protein [Tanacetum cinerariifolium]